MLLHLRFSPAHPQLLLIFERVTSSKMVQVIVFLYLFKTFCIHGYIRNHQHTCCQ